MKTLLVSIWIALFMLSIHASSPQYMRSFLRGNTKLETDSNPERKPTWKEIIDAFIDGTEIDDMFDNTTECVHDFEISYEDIYEATNHFIQRGWTWENWIDLNGAIGTITPLVRTCYDPTHDSINDAKDYFGSFNSIIDFGMQARDNVLVHIFDWYDVSAKINDYFQKGKTKDLANEIGHALNLFFVFDPKSPREARSTQSMNALPDLHWLENFLQGFINGTQVLSSESVVNCVNETLFMVDSLTDANAQFKKGGEEGFKQGVFEIADMCEHSKPLNQECKNGLEDVIKIVQKYINTFKNPSDILFNAAKHFMELYQDSIDFMQSLNKEEWYDAGLDLGDMFYLVFVDK